MSLQEDIERVWHECGVEPTGRDMTNECRLAARILADEKTINEDAPRFYLHLLDTVWREAQGVAPEYFDDLTPERRLEILKKARETFKLEPDEPSICSEHQEKQAGCTICQATIYNIFPAEEVERAHAAAEAAGQTVCKGCGFAFYLTVKACPRCEEPEAGLPPFRAKAELENHNNALRTIYEMHASSCKDEECMICGVLACPKSEPLHFHHDGCPAECGT